MQKTLEIKKTHFTQETFEKIHNFPSILCMDAAGDSSANLQGQLKKCRDFPQLWERDGVAGLKKLPPKKCLHQQQMHGRQQNNDFHPWTNSHVPKMKLRVSHRPKITFSKLHEMEKWL